MVFFFFYKYVLKSDMNCHPKSIASGICPRDASSPVKGEGTVIAPTRPSLIASCPICPKGAAAATVDRPSRLGTARDGSKAENGVCGLN